MANGQGPYTREPCLEKFAQRQRILKRQDAKNTKEDENFDFFGLKTYLPWWLGGEKMIGPGFDLEFSLV